MATRIEGGALHLFERLDAQHSKALPQDPGGQVAEDQAAGALGGFGFEHGAVLVEAGEMAGEFVEVIAEEIGAVFFGDGFQDQAEVEQVPGQRDFLGGAEFQARSGEGDPAPVLRRLCGRCCGCGRRHIAGRGRCCRSAPASCPN